MSVLKCHHPRRQRALPVTENLKTRSCKINAVPSGREMANILQENRILSLRYMFKHTHCKSLHRRKRNIGCPNWNHLHKPASAYSCTESNLIGCVKIWLQAVYQEGLILDGLQTDRQTDRHNPRCEFSFSALTNTHSLHSTTINIERCGIWQEHCSFSQRVSRKNLT